MTATDAAEIAPRPRKSRRVAPARGTAETLENPGWPADKIERWAVAKLIPYARNARKHDAAQIAEIAGAIAEWGWTAPVLIDETGRIIAGHGRVLAAQQLGIVEIPAIVARGWTETQKRAYALADNEIAAHSSWNKELLRVELSDLAAQAVDLKLMGFDAADIATIDPRAGELPQALQLEPPREYAVIMCADEDEWSRLKVALGLTPVRRGGYKQGSDLGNHTGTQRVVKAADVLRLIHRASAAA